jgi:hypothetical protein
VEGNSLAVVVSRISVVCCIWSIAEVLRDARACPYIVLHSGDGIAHVELEEMSVIESHQRSPYPVIEEVYQADQGHLRSPT